MQNTANFGGTSLVYPYKRTKKTKNYMKNVYVSPLATEVNVEATNMLAASLRLNNEKTVDTSDGGQLSGGHRGQWGNLWN